MVCMAFYSFNIKSSTYHFDLVEDKDSYFINIIFLISQNLMSYPKIKATINLSEIYSKLKTHPYATIYPYLKPKIIAKLNN